MGQMIFSILLGLFLFLFGCFKLGEIVIKVFNLHLRTYLSKINQNPFWGLLSGFVLTVALQSSSAAVILALGFLGAGLLTFSGSLPFILAASLASFITPYLVAVNLIEIAPLFIIFGGLVWLLSREKIKKIGEAVFYFGLLFFGLKLIIEAATGQNGFLAEVLTSSRPFFGFLWGLVLTIVFQASAVPLSILVVLAKENTLNLALVLQVFPRKPPNLFAGMNRKVILKLTDIVDI